MYIWTVRVKCRRKVGERPSRLCRGTHEMPLALYAAFAYINKGARLFSHSAIVLPHPWTRVRNFFYKLNKSKDHVNIVLQPKGEEILRT
jgi:hypothetical protein